MKRQIAHRICRCVVLILPILMIAGSARAQLVVGAKAGIINYIQGEVFLDGKLLKNLPDSFPHMENGQSLRTKQGSAELLLASSVYLRLGENGSLRMEQNRLNDTQLALDQGSALIEVVEETKGNRASVRLSAGVVEIKKVGLYRLDAGSGELRVYGGAAMAESGKRKARIKSGRMVRLDGDFASAKFDANVADMLHLWAAQRSFDLFVANTSTRKQMHWKPISLGWLLNYNYRMRFYSELFFDEWIKNRKNEQALETVAERARAAAIEQARQVEAEAAAQAIQAWQAKHAEAAAQGQAAQSAGQPQPSGQQPDK